MLKNRIKKINNKGFTLIEAIIAIGIFSVVLTATFGILATGIRTQHVLRARQQSAEEFINAINLISKRVRMSEIVSPDPGGLAVSAITVRDNTDDANYTYSFNGTELRLGSDVLATNVSGNFYVSTDNPKRLTITMKPADADASDNRARIQTTVSTRVYEESD